MLEYFLLNSFTKEDYEEFKAKEDVDSDVMIFGSYEELVEALEKFEEDACKVESLKSEEAVLDFYEVRNLSSGRLYKML